MHIHLSTYCHPHHTSIACSYNSKSYIPVIHGEDAIMSSVDHEQAFVFAFANTFLVVSYVFDDDNISFFNIRFGEC